MSDAHAMANIARKHVRLDARRGILVPPVPFRDVADRVRFRLRAGRLEPSQARDFDDWSPVDARLDGDCKELS